MKEFIRKFINSLLVVIFMAFFSRFIQKPTIFHYLSLLFVLLLFYYLVIPLLFKLWLLLMKDLRKRYPVIGILNGNIESPIREFKCQRAWTNVTPSMWYTALKIRFKRRKIRMLSALQISNSFSIIINPFGDIFPEEDLRLHTTFYKICKFIEKGGFFICTGGAFWSHQNPKISESAEWVFVRTQDGKQSLKESFLYKEFGIIPTGDIFANNQIIQKEPLEIEVYEKEEDKLCIGEIVKQGTKVKRFRAATPDSTNYIPLIREKNDKSFPIVAVKYGDGYLIHVGLFLDSVTSTEFNILLELINSCIQKKFENF